MDRESKELLQSIEGRDKDGNANAVCGIHIFDISDEPPVEVRGYACIDAEVAFDIIPGGMSEITLIFEDEDDYDYMKVADVCREFDERVQEGEEVLINLTLTHGGSYDRYISAMCRSWANDVPDDNIPQNAIRFFVETEQIFEVSAPGEMVVGMIDPMGSAYDVDWIG